MRKGSERSSKKSPAVAPDARANLSQVEKVVQDHNYMGQFVRFVVYTSRNILLRNIVSKWQADVQDKAQPKHLINSL